MKTLLSKENHLRFQEQKKVPDRGIPRRSIYEFRDECILAAREIATSFPGSKIVVMMSGGADSEVCAESFRAAKIPFSAMIVRLEADLNLHDISWAIDYCEEKNVPYSFYDFKIRDHFERSKRTSLLLETGKLFPSYNMLARVISSLKMEDRIVPIIGGGEPEFSWHKSKLYYYEYESDFSVFRYMQKNQIPGVPLFFEWSPELHWSFIFSKEIQSFICTGPANYVTSEPVKFDMYQRQFGIRKRTKYNGFEKAVAYFPDLVRDVTRELENEIHAVEYFDLLKNLKHSLRFASAGPGSSAKSLETY